MTAARSERDVIERLVGQPVTDPARARWGFTNRTEMVTLSNGDRVAVQRYRRRVDAERRLRVMRALAAPAFEAGIAIPRIREADLDADPPWVMFEALPGVPVPEAGEGLEDPGFPAVARAMGEPLASFRELPTTGLEMVSGPSPSGSLSGRRGGLPRSAPSTPASAARSSICSSAPRRCSRTGPWCSRMATSRRSTS